MQRTNYRKVKLKYIIFKEINKEMEGYSDENEPN